MKNPTRRNKNIGTDKQGHGQNNRLVIPDSWRDTKIFYERLQSPIFVKRYAHKKDFIIIIEPTLDDYAHCCTADDIEKVLSLLPANDARHIDIIVLRQPTRKQQLLSSVWGRLAFYYEADQCNGVAIVLEAQPINYVYKWKKSIDPFVKKELERLECDGHKITYKKKYITIESTLEACRNTQLYRTIPHEIGHFLDDFTNPKKFETKNHRDKEEFAHQYADNFILKMKKENRLYFERIIDKTGMKKELLDIKWFTTE